MRRVIAIAVCSLSLVGLSAGAASAGEITGNGKWIQIHARSECAYSGLNDYPNAPFPEGGRVQSYGQLVRLGLIPPQEFNPGDACNPNALPPG